MPHARTGQLIEVTYDAPEALAPDRQQELVQAIRAASAQGPVGLVFVVTANTRVVDPRVPGFWLDRVREPDLRIHAMAVASSRLAVRVAASAFGRAAGMLRLNLQVQAFDDPAAARAWVQPLLGP